MPTSLKPLNEQVVVITGASSGIGLATAKLAAERGAKLVLASRSERTLKSIVQDLRAQGAAATFVVADVSDRAQVEQIARTALATYGRIDTWVNNAGLSIYGRLDEVSERDSRRLFDVNFWGVVNGSLVALDYMRGAPGALINVGSEVSDAVLPLQGIYAASKHAVKGFTDALRVEIECVDRSPLSITLIQPTAVNTPYPQHAKNYMAKEPKLPTPQLEPYQVAEAILQAATERSRDVLVGTMARVNTALFKLVPTLADRMAARQVDRQQYEQSPRDPAGALYKPSETGKVRGEQPRQPAIQGN